MINFWVFPSFLPKILPNFLIRKDRRLIIMKNFKSQTELKLLFLDIDGVLNSESSGIALGIGSPARINRYTMNKNQELVYYPHSKRSLLWSDVSVGILLKIIQEFDYQIVISSSWRHFVESTKEWEQMFNLYHHGFTGKVYGITPKRSYALDDLTRGSCIEEFLKDCPDQVDDYIILDDNSDMTKTQIEENKFIKINGTYGLCSDEYYKIKRINAK